MAATLRPVVPALLLEVTERPVGAVATTSRRWTGRAAAQCVSTYRLRWEGVTDVVVVASVKRVHPYCHPRGPREGRARLGTFALAKVLNERHARNSLLGTTFRVRPVEWPDKDTGGCLDAAPPVSIRGI